jgi:hypothetical protein
MLPTRQVAMQILDGLRRQQNEQLLAVLEEEQAKEAEREVRLADVYQQKDKVCVSAPLQLLYVRAHVSPAGSFSDVEYEYDACSLRSHPACDPEKFPETRLHGNRVV